MLAIRYQVGNTGENLTAALDFLRHQGTVRLVLFASPPASTNVFSRSDGPMANLPLLAALAEFAIPHAGSVYVVMDGLFLTAARQSRYSEVRTLLDEAQLNPKAFYSPSRAPFTSGLSPEDAAAKLLSVAPVLPFASAARQSFFSLLSNVPESVFSNY